MRKSQQQLLDERMCKPGYTWNHTLKRCIGGYGSGKHEDPALEQPPETPPPADAAGSGRNTPKTNANGVQQSGTKM